jgi:hypothetical protein
MKLGISDSAADCRVQSVDPNDRNASGLRTENLTRAAKLDKFGKHANEKERGNAEHYADCNREYQVDGSDQHESSMHRRS